MGFLWIFILFDIIMVFMTVVVLILFISMSKSKKNNSFRINDNLDRNSIDMDLPEKKKYIDNTNVNYVDTDRFLNAEDDDLKQEHSNASRLIQKCDVCGKKSELSYTYCPYCGAFLLGDIVSDEENK